MVFVAADSMSRSEPLLLVLLLASCAADDCSSACKQQKGLWLAQTGCADSALAELRWQVEVSTSEGICRARADWCNANEIETEAGAYDCESRLASFRFGTAVCALTIGDRALTAICRSNGKICEYGFLKLAASALTCNASRDAGADSASDAPSNTMPDALAETARDAPTDLAVDSGRS